MMHGLLTQTCTIQTASTTASDAHNMPVWVWANTHENVPCRFQAGSGREEDDDVQAALTKHTLFLAGTGDSIDEDDRVVYSGQTYEVRNVREILGFGDAVHHVEVELEAVEIG